MPDSNPNCWLVIPNSLFIVSAAKPMLIRSTKLMTNRTKTNGMTCVSSLRIVVASIDLGGAGAEAISHLGLASLIAVKCSTDQRGSEAVVKSPFHSLSHEKANKKRTLVLMPGYVR